MKNNMKLLTAPFMFYLSAAEILTALLSAFCRGKLQP